MPQLLISVTSIEEAKIALENGADIIDLKDPNTGALGALPVQTLIEITHYVNWQKPVSATIGDLPMQAEVIFAAVEKLMNLGVDYIKIGFFASDDDQYCIKALKPLIENGGQLIAVLFAEKTYPSEMINKIKDAGFVGIMLDTAEKNGRTLLDYYSATERLNFCQSVLRQHLTLGLAGSLNINHIETIKALTPTYIGFRGGLCEDNQRTSYLNVEKIKALCKLL